MKNLLSWVAALSVLACAGPAACVARAQEPFPSAEPQAQAPASPGPPSAASDQDRRAAAYYDLIMAHLYEQDYEASNSSDDVNRSIDFYKQAYALDPTSGVIGEQLAEMYFIAQRVRDAVLEVQDVLRRDPANVPARRLLSRIYIRSLGDLSASSDQQDIVKKAIEQLAEINRLDPTDADSALWLARLDRLSGKQEEAERVLRQIMTQDVDDQDAMQQLTQLLLDEKRLDEAIALLQQNIERDPSGALYEQLGDAYSQKPDLAHAEEAYRHAVELEPLQPSHRRALAQSLFDQEKYDEAAVEYNGLVKAEPDDATNYLRLAEIYRQFRQFPQAEQQVLLAKKRAPGNLEVIYNEASIYEAEERYDDAIRVVSGAVTAVSGQADFTPERRRTLAILYQLLGQLYSDAQNYTVAITTFEEMRALGPEEDRRARLLIIDAYRANRDLPHALDAARKAVADYPGDRNLHIGQALLYGDNKQTDQASQVLRALLDHSHDDLEIYLDLAQMYEQDQRFGDAEQAVGAAQKFAERPAEKNSVAFVLGGILAHEKKYDEAEQVFRNLLAVDPHNAPVLNYYGYILADRGQRLDEAVGLVRQALAEDPTNPAYLDSIGWAYYKQDKLSDAETSLRKAVDRDSHDPTILSHLGDILAKRGQTGLAEMEWEKSLAEWHRAMPADFEADKVAELEQKISSAKGRAADPKPFALGSQNSGAVNAAGESSPHPAETEPQ